MLSMIFDTIFFTQHYILYRDHTDPYLEKELEIEHQQRYVRHHPDQRHYLLLNTTTTDAHDQ